MVSKVIFNKNTIEDDIFDMFKKSNNFSAILSNKLGYREVNKGGSGKSHDEIIKETLLYAYKNKDNSDNIIINVMLTSPERILMYCNDKSMVFNWWLIMDTGAPHGGSGFEDWRFDERQSKSATRKSESGFD